MQQTKNIKVLYSCRESQSHTYPRKTTYVPKISMEGKWLENLGFQIGMSLEVEYSMGELRIRPISINSSTPDTVS